MIEIGIIVSLLIAGIIFGTYRLIRTLGYPKVGKYIAEILFFLSVALIILIIFEDELFTKSDAKKLLAEQKVLIKDDFDIEENKSMSSPGDYYHTFTLKITADDKERIINEIKKSNNFNKDKPVNSYLYDRTDYYTGPKRIKNYETKELYIRELFEPQGKGYAPTWRKIQIVKKENKLIFEDIDE